MKQFFKKHGKFTLLVLLAALLCGSAAWAVSAKRAADKNASTVKFHVDVTGYAPADADGTRAKVPVNADVYGDYHFVVTMPDVANSTVGADKATVNVRMTGVQTLGLKEGETRSYSKTVETGVSGVNASLSTALSNVYGFKGATIPVTIKSGATTAQFDYQIGAFANNQIVGTPSDEAKAREAWHLLTSKVQASQNLSQNDTHFLFKKGAYVLIGDEMLIFDQDYDFLKGTADLSTLFSDVRPYVHVAKSGLSGQAANKAVVYLPAGSTLGISSSAAVLNEDAFLTVDATSKPSMNITGKLSGLRDQLAKSGDGATKVAIAYAVGMFNDVVGLVDQAENVPVTLEFKKTKFHVDVTGYSSDDENAVPVAVNADVYNNYSFDVQLPAPGSDQLTASKATVNLRMTDVNTLGVTGTRSYSKTVETGVSGVTATLSDALKNTYKFAGATCPVTIKDGNEEKSFTYNIAGINDLHIVGTPSNEEDARAAWHLMTSHVTASQDQSVNDTHFLFKQGSYLQIGDERLVFLKDFDFLKGSASMKTLFDGAQVRVEKANVTGAKTVKAAVYLPAGSTLGVSSSAATVDADVKVTMTGEDKASEANAITGFFTSMKSGDAKSMNAKAAIAALVQYFDQIVGMVDQADGVSFTVEFTQPKTPKFHLDVTGYDYNDTTKEIAVNADVYGDYSFKVQLPDPLNDNLTASKATVNVWMTGVQTLGLKPGETRSFSKTLETGVSGVSAKLSTSLKNTYAFGGVKCPVTIKDANGEKSFTYTIDGINEDYQIVGTPSSEQAAREAWRYMTAHVNALGNVQPGDTHFLFKKGAYLQIGDEKLVFDQDYDFLKGTADLDELFSGIRPAVHVAKVKAGTPLKQAVVYLPAGSTLGVSNSAATVDQDVTVTMDGSKSQASDDSFKNLLSGYRDKVYANGNANKQTAIALLVYYFDQVIGAVDNADEVPFTVEFTQPKVPKFHLDVTGYSSDDKDAVPVAVNADVYGDYHFDVELPVPGNDQLTASKATVNIVMNGVQTLGLKPGESRSYSKTVETGVPGVTANLSDALKNTYAFQGATCPVTIKENWDGGKSEQFDYNIAGIEDYHIIGTPSDSLKARAAWHLMTSHVTASQDQSVNDTHFLFKQGSYLQIGDERLVFLKDFDFLKGSASMKTLFDGAQVRVEKANVTGAKTVKAAVYLPAGSTLGVSSSAATVDKDVKVTMTGEDKASEANAITGFFTSMKSGDAKSMNAKAAIAALVQYFDQIVGMVDQADGVSFTVEFTQPKTPKFHLDVTGYSKAEGGTPATVSADVYGDYSFKVQLPDVLNDSLNANRATVNVWMTGVQSLGLKPGETRNYSKTIETGVSAVTVQLHKSLTNTYGFTRGTVPVTIKEDWAGGDTKQFTYNIAGINEDYQIVGTPSSEQAARDAWWFMTKHVTAQKGVQPGDTHFLFKRGAYLQIGNERVVFKKDFDFLKGGASMDKLLDGAETQLVTLDEIPMDSAAVIYLPAGSTLGISNSAATVAYGVKVSVDARKSGVEADQLKGLLTSFTSKASNAKAAIALLVNYFDQVVGLVNAAEEVPVTVEFIDNSMTLSHFAKNADQSIAAGDLVTIKGYKLQGVKQFQDVDGNNYLVVRDNYDTAAKPDSVRDYVNTAHGDELQSYLITGTVVESVGIGQNFNAQENYHQNNWLLVKLGKDVAENYEGCSIKQVSGTVVSTENPEIEDGTVVTDNEEFPAFAPNYYCATNFMGGNVFAAGAGLYQGQDFFFMTPKAVEYMVVTYATYSNGNFYVTTREGNANGNDFSGGFEVNWKFNADGDIHDLLEANGMYQFHAIAVLKPTTVAKAPAKVEAKVGDVSSVYTIYPIDLSTDSRARTGVNDVVAGKTVQRVTYVNMAGLTSDKPFDGVNIVVTRYTDGTQTTAKKLVR